MNNKEAISKLRQMKNYYHFESYAKDSDYKIEALDLAIKALEPDEEVNEFTCPFCGDVTYTATDYIPRFCQECGRDMGFREADE